MAGSYQENAFAGPSYATPEQTAQLRAYANQLLSQQPAAPMTNWTQALGQALTGVFGRQQMQKANELQRQLLQQGQQRVEQAGQQNPMAAAILGMSPLGAPAGMPAQQAQPMQPSGNQPRGIRNNNPGNIEDGAFAKSIPGYAGTDGRFAIFNSPQAGQQAMDRLLTSYGNRGIDTPQAIASRWAPAGDGGNNPMAYASTVAGQMGVSPTSHLNMNDPAVRSALASGITRMENGPGHTMQAAQASPQSGGNLSAFYVDSSVPDALKNTVREGLTPKPVQDVYGRPGTMPASGLGGITGQPVQGQFQPGHLVPASAGAAGATVSTQMPLTAPNQGGAAPNVQGQMQPLFDAARNFGLQGAANKATQGAVEQDVQAANLVPQTRQILSTMKDDILAHGDKMVFGPTADWINNLKRSVAQHAPGLMSDSDLQGLASADSFDKLSAQLQSIVGRQVGGTDASLMQGMRSVPGQHNSKQGALALIDMLDQVSQQQAKFMIQNQYKIGQPGFNFLEAKNNFFEQNPITNPLTGHPLRMDLSEKGNQPIGQTKMIGGKTYQKINGVWHEAM